MYKKGKQSYAEWFSETARLLFPTSANEEEERQDMYGRDDLRDMSSLMPLVRETAEKNQRAAMSQSQMVSAYLASGEADFSLEDHDFINAAVQWAQEQAGRSGGPGFNGGEEKYIYLDGQKLPAQNARTLAARPEESNWQAQTLENRHTNEQIKAALIPAWNSNWGGERSGGHHELNRHFVEEAGFTEEWLEIMNEASDDYDGIFNQLNRGHAMPDKNKIDEALEWFGKDKVFDRRGSYVDEFRKEYELACKIFAVAARSTDAELDKIREQRALWHLGRANHILGDYRSHYLRGDGGRWRNHVKGIFRDSSKHPDYALNMPEFFADAKKASAYLGGIFKAGRRELNERDLLLLFPAVGENV